MFTNSSRKLLCFLLSLFMVAGICAFTGSTLVRSTLCYQSYMEIFVTSGKVSRYCDNAYNERIAILAENSSIPIRVFDATDNVSGYSETVAGRFYSGSDTTVFTLDKIETYEKLFKEYLDGNDIIYDDEAVHNTAVKAAEIYADSYGMKDTSALKVFVDNAVAEYGRISSIALAVAVISAALIFVMYTDSKKTVKYYTSAFSAAGLSFISVGVISLAVSLGKGSVITPDVYRDAIFSAISVMFVILILLGVVVTAVSTFIALKQNKLIGKGKRK